ncbi:MAG: twitching motility protein PilJ, partial [Comamonadaceae bacterium]
MAVFDQLKNLFKKKTPELDQDSRLSLGMPYPSVYQAQDGDPTPSEVMQESPRSQYGSLGEGAATVEAVKEPEVQESDAHSAEISIPILGKKTIVQHQRMLSVVLGLSLVLLAVVTLLGLNKSDQTAQQLNATGQALMQSQRLAKEVTQALMGREKSFESIKDASTVLSKTVRGMKSGDNELKLEELTPEFLPMLENAVPLIDRTEKNASTILSQQKILTQ